MLFVDLRLVFRAETSDEPRFSKDDACVVRRSQALGIRGQGNHGSTASDVIYNNVIFDIQRSVFKAGSGLAGRTFESSLGGQKRLFSYTPFKYRFLLLIAVLTSLLEREMIVILTIAANCQPAYLFVVIEPRRRVCLQEITAKLPVLKPVYGYRRVLAYSVSSGQRGMVLSREQVTYLAMPEVPPLLGDITQTMCSGHSR
jgi:hypothetical protein